jgi:hypothetical protein
LQDSVDFSTKWLGQGKGSGGLDLASKDLTIQEFGVKGSRVNLCRAESGGSYGFPQHFAFHAQVRGFSKHVRSQQARIFRFRRAGQRRIGGFL